MSDSEDEKRPVSPPTGEALSTDANTVFFLGTDGNDIFAFNGSFEYNLSDRGGDDYYVIGQHQTGDVFIGDTVGDNKLYFDKGVVINKVEFSGASLIFTLESGGTLQVNSAERYDFYLGNGSALKATEVESMTGAITVDSYAKLSTETSITPIAPSNQYQAFVIGGSEVDIYTLGFSQDGRLSGGRGDDLYFITRFQYAENIEIFDSLGNNQIIIDAGISISRIVESGSSFDVTFTNGGFLRINSGGDFTYHIGGYQPTNTIDGDTFISTYGAGLTLTIENTNTLTVSDAVNGTITGSDGDINILDASATSGMVDFVNNTAAIAGTTYTLLSVDTYIGGNGVDTITASITEHNIIDGGSGSSDVIYVGAGTWTVTDRTAETSFSFTINNDTVNHSISNVENLIASNSADTFKLGSIIADLSFNAEAGDDTLEFTSAGIFDLTTADKMSGMDILNFETLSLANGANTLTINMNSNQFDTINLGSGTNALIVSGTDSAHIDLSGKTYTIASASAEWTGNAASVTGGEAADSLKGGVGDDSFTGGGGADTFIASAGSDTITDFSKANDVVDLSGWGLTDLAAATYAIASGNLSIMYGGNTLTIMGEVFGISDASDTDAVVMALTDSGRFPLITAQRGTIFHADTGTSRGYFASRLGADFISFENAADAITFDLSSGNIGDGSIVKHTLGGIEGVIGSRHNDTITLDSSATNIYAASLGTDTVNGFGTDDVLDFRSFVPLTLADLTFTNDGTDTKITSTSASFSGEINLTGVVLEADTVEVLFDDYKPPRVFDIAMETIAGSPDVMNDYLRLSNTVVLWIVNLGSPTAITYAGAEVAIDSGAYGITAGTFFFEGITSTSIGTAQPISNINWIDGGNVVGFLIGDDNDNVFFNIGFGSTLQGGRGHDTYYISAHREGNEFDITDFNSGDTISFEETPLFDADGITYGVDGDDATIGFGSRSIILKGQGGTKNANAAAVEAAFADSIVGLADDRIIATKYKAPFSAFEANRLDFDISADAYTVLDYSTETDSGALIVNLSGLRYHKGSLGNVAVNDSAHYISFFADTDNGSSYDGGSSPTINDDDNTPRRAAAIDAIIGSRNPDVILANENDNYFDPIGGVDNGDYSAAHFRGFEGADTLVINESIGITTYQFRDLNIQEGDKIDFRKIGVATVADVSIVKIADHDNGLQFRLGATNFIEANQTKLVVGANITEAVFNAYGNDDAERIEALFSEIGIFTNDIAFADPTNPNNLPPLDTYTVSNRNDHFIGSESEETTLDFTNVNSGIRINLHPINTYKADGKETSIATEIAVYQGQAYAVNDATLPVSAAKIISAWSFSDIDHVVGTAHADLLIGNDGNNTLSGGGGNDTFVISAGTDTITDLGTSDVVDWGTISESNFTGFTFANDSGDLKISGFSVGGTTGELIINGQGANANAAYWTSGAGAGSFKFMSEASPAQENHFSLSFGHVIELDGAILADSQNIDFNAGDRIIFDDTDSVATAEDLSHADISLQGGNIIIDFGKDEVVVSGDFNNNLFGTDNIVDNTGDFQNFLSVLNVEFA